MSRTLQQQFPAIKLCAEEKKIQKRKRMINACCDHNFTKAITECCWNVTNGRTPLTENKVQQLKRHKTLLRKLSSSSVPLKQRTELIQTGSGFAALLPLLLGPIISGVTQLIKRK